MELTTYSCRAETAIDAVRFLSLGMELADADAVFFYRPQLASGPWGDSTLEFITTLDREAILALLHRVPDAHVMRETLRACPLAENSLERDPAVA
jgi:hypothetical protein